MTSWNKAERSSPKRIINAIAPMRICDNGGWTDTWFAEHGKVFNIAVSPFAEVQLELFSAQDVQDQVVIFAENYGDSYAVNRDQPGWDRHPLLEAAIEVVGIPDELAITARIYSAAPGGASTGTSAAVTVALVGALDRITPGRLAPHEVAYKAHAVEVDRLELQSGIQDQLCSSFGGMNYIEMFSYPHATVSKLPVSEDICQELEQRLVLIYLGKSHSSSAMHEEVIGQLEDAGPDCRQLNDLRKTAEPSRDAVYAGDFKALGRAMIANTEAQRRLHSGLLSADAQRVIDIAKEHGALGWKLNGAGGDGGSITILCGDRYSTKRVMIGEIESDNRSLKNIPVRYSAHGLHVWERKVKD